MLKIVVSNQDLKKARELFSIVRAQKLSVIGRRSRVPVARKWRSQHRKLKQ